MDLGYIKKHVESYLNIKDIGVRNREDRYKLGRWAYYKIAKKYTTESLSAIGREVGGLTHASVINSLKTYSEDSLDGYLEIYIDCINLFSDDINLEKEREMLEASEGKITADLSAYIADLKRKAKDAAVDAHIKLKKQVPWIDDYNRLSGEDQIRFDQWAKAKLRFI